ncbi:MAG: hypothetical protein ACM3NQ_23730 [Bacteroidales bacterium]
MSRTASRQALFAARNGLPWVRIIALAALAVACSGRGQQTFNPASPSAVPVAATLATGGGPAAQQGVARQAGGTLNGRFDFTHMWGSEWWQFYSDSDTTGTLSHFGLSRLHTRHTPNLMTGALEQGEFTIVAANGDEVRGTYQGMGTYDPIRADLVHGTATFVVTGGTGRFAGATGSIAATFLETLDDPSWASAAVTWTLAGTINY